MADDTTRDDEAMAVWKGLSRQQCEALEWMPPEGRMRSVNRKTAPFDPTLAALFRKGLAIDGRSVGFRAVALTNLGLRVRAAGLATQADRA